jgi:NAD(P)-dependent dehydrogenase (short-subunit alcohol dehydrogenase family)
MRFNEKAVLITGASSGIGRATALAFAREGASLMLTDVNDEGGQATLAQVQEVQADTGASAQYLHTDVSQASDHEAMVKATLEAFGGLHITVNSAGISGKFVRPIFESDEEDFDRVIAVNLKGVWLGMKYQIPAIMQSGGGSVINLASVAGLIGAAGGADYAASKHGVVGLTRSVALEMARHNVRVNAVCPSFVDTPMVQNVVSNNEKMDVRTRRASPMQRLGTPAEVASAILWLADDSASFVNGIALAVDGGLTAM